MVGEPLRASSTVAVATVLQKRRLEDLLYLHPGHSRLYSNVSTGVETILPKVQLCFHLQLL